MCPELDEQERREVSRKAREAVLVALKTLGGEANRHVLLDRARRDGDFSERELSAPVPETARGKHPTFVEYRLSWALSNLKRDGLVENPKWSVWRLSDVIADTAPQAAAEPISVERLAELRAMSYRDYLHTPEWRCTRAAALARAGHRCQLDRSHTADLDVHHNTYERLGAELAADLVVLCHSCHQLHHAANGQPRRSTTDTAAEATLVAGSIAPASPPPAPSGAVLTPQRSLLRRLLGTA